MLYQAVKRCPASFVRARDRKAGKPRFVTGAARRSLERRSGTILLSAFSTSSIFDARAEAGFLLEYCNVAVQFGLAIGRPLGFGADGVVTNVDLAIVGEAARGSR